jgi:hypothetical protein
MRSCCGRRGTGSDSWWNTQAKEAETEPMTVILDWTAKLNK